MPRLKSIQPVPASQLEALAFSWHTDSDGEPYIADELLEITVDEANAYATAADELYKMYLVAVKHVIQHQCYDRLGIHPNLVPIIEKSWSDGHKMHLYGRFDLAGGIDGKPIKLIEFNADTPTMVVETAMVQWMLLLHNNLQDHKQFNGLYKALYEKFSSFQHAQEKPYTSMLFSSISDIAEEKSTVRFLQKVASDAGIITHFTPLESVTFDQDGIYDESDTAYDYWFKLFPWEDIIHDAAETVPLLHQHAVSVLNPAYTLLMQSKGMLTILYELFPDSPYLLETSDRPLRSKYVKKPMFGREGANVQIIDPTSGTLHHIEGPYDHYPAVYQEYIDFPKDPAGRYYQAGVFVCDEACALGFRRGGEILDNLSRFIGHIITD